MEDLILNGFIAFVILILVYQIKIKKNYNLVAGLSDYNLIQDKYKKKKLQQEAIMISNSGFLSVFLIIIMSILNYIFEFDKKIINNEILLKLVPAFIILLSLFAATIYYLIQKFSNKK